MIDQSVFVVLEALVYWKADSVYDLVWTLEAKMSVKTVKQYCQDEVLVI